MKGIKFIQVQKDSPQHYELFKALMLPYNIELDVDSTDNEPASEGYYGDLVVKPSYRRMKIASRLIKTAIQKIKDMGSETLCCYVEPTNRASKHLQKSIGFIEKPTQPFNLLTVDGAIMFELNIGIHLNTILATVDGARFIMMFYAQNREALHGKRISLDEWKNCSSATHLFYDVQCHKPHRQHEPQQQQFS